MRITRPPLPVHIRCLSCCALAATPAMAGPPLCFAPTPYTVGVEPSCVIMADLNGDGVRDLAVANHDLALDNRISILINQGSGTFEPSVYYDAGDRPYWIAAGDIDGDDDLDLAVSNYFDTTVSVFINDGTGVFAPQVPYDIGNGPGFVVLAQLDGDADLDLAVTNINDYTVSILMNNGDGTFAEQVAYPAGPGPYGLIAVNLDADPALDLAMCNHHDDTVSVLLNNGDGTFAPLVPYDVDDGPVGIDFADLDGDGDMDLACANTEGNATGTTVSVLKNNGDGTFATHVPMTVPVGPYTLKIADFNGDGWGDLTCSHESGFATVLLNNGDGTFATPAEFAIGSLPVGLDAGDLDGNGTPEVAVTCYGADQVWVLFNQYAGIETQPANASVTAGQAAVFSVVAGGPGPFTYQWRRDGIDLVDAGNISGAQTDTLTINPVALTDADDYDVVVTNDCGSMTSNAAQLVVLPACVADISPEGVGDQQVNINDLLAVINTWGACQPQPVVCWADISPAGPPRGDGQVNINDLLDVINNWGPCPN